MKASSRKGRIDWVDVAKGIGIILVVIGHSVRGLTSSGILERSNTVIFFDRWLYSFHMPLFFFLSGFFLIRSARAMPFPSFVADKIRTIAYPYILWSVITIVLKSLLGNIPNSPRGIEDLSLIAYAPVEQFWFLYVLFFISLIFGAAFWLGLRPIPITVVALGFYLVPSMNNLPTLWQMQHFSIFVALGAAIGTRFLSNIASRGMLVILLLSAVVPMLTHAELVVALAGIGSSVCIAILLDRIHGGTILQAIGRYSLEIFVLHSTVSAGVRTLLKQVGIMSPTTHLLVGICSGILCPIIFAQLLTKLNIKYGFSFPRTNRLEQNTTSHTA